MRVRIIPLVLRIVPGTQLAVNMYLWNKCWVDELAMGKKSLQYSGEDIADYQYNVLISPLQESLGLRSIWVLVGSLAAGPGRATLLMGGRAGYADIRERKMFVCFFPFAFWEAAYPPSNAIGLTTSWKNTVASPPPLAAPPSLGMWLCSLSSAWPQDAPRRALKDYRVH